jgi:hypothetical protein
MGDAEKRELLLPALESYITRQPSQDTDDWPGQTGRGLGGAGLRAGIK